MTNELPDPRGHLAAVRNAKQEAGVVAALGQALVALARQQDRSHIVTVWTLLTVLGATCANIGGYYSNLDLLYSSIVFAAGSMLMLQFNLLVAPALRRWASRQRS